MPLECMAPGSLRAACALAVALVIPALARAEAPPPSRNQINAAFLQAVQNAARRASYEGTIAYQRGPEVHSSQVIHYFDGIRPRERILTLDGQEREYIRSGDELQCLYPRLRRIVIEQDALASFPAFADGAPVDVLAHYEMRAVGVDRVAGRPCEVVALVPRDDLRYGYRLCVEPQSRLLFRAQTLGLQGKVLEQVWFSSVRVGDGVDPAQLRPSWSTEGWTVERAQSPAIELASKGWSVTPPDGFHRLTEVMRTLSATADRTERLAWQAVYTDGLATVSVFIEPNVPPGDMISTEQRVGPVTAVSQRVGDARVTVVGEVPPSAAHDFLRSVVYARPR